MVTSMRDGQIQLPSAPHHEHGSAIAVDVRGEVLRDGAPVSFWQVTCGCGWRSSRLAAPAGSQSQRGALVVPPHFREIMTLMCGRIWRWHLTMPRDAAMPPEGN